MLKSLRLKAYAKLNPSLYVGARRFDGFHPLESAAVTVDVNIIPNPADGLARVLGERCGKNMGFGKNLFDFYPIKNKGSNGKFVSLP